MGSLFPLPAPTNAAKTAAEALHTYRASGPSHAMALHGFPLHSEDTTSSADTLNCPSHVFPNPLEIDPVSISPLSFAPVLCIQMLPVVRLAVASTVDVCHCKRPRENADSYCCSDLCLISYNGDDDTGRTAFPSSHKQEVTGARGALFPSAATTTVSTVVVVAAGDPIRASDTRRLFAALPTPRGTTTATSPNPALVGSRGSNVNNEIHHQYHAGSGVINTTGGQAPSTEQPGKHRSLTASRSDLHALQCLFPAMHAGQLYHSAAEYVEHCEAADAHLILCEDMPLVPLVTSTMAETVDAAKNSASDPKCAAGCEEGTTGSVWQQEGRQEDAKHIMGPLKPAEKSTRISGEQLPRNRSARSLKPAVLNRFCLAYGPTMDALAALTAEEDITLDAVTRLWLPFHLAWHIATTLSGPDTDSERSPAATIAEGDETNMSVTPYPDETSLTSMCAAVEKAVAKAWSALCTRSVRSDTQHSASMFPHVPSTSSNVHLSSSSARERLTVALSLFTQQPPPLLRAVVVPVAEALVKRARTCERAARTAALYESVSGNGTDVESDSNDGDFDSDEGRRETPQDRPQRVEDGPRHNEVTALEMLGPETQLHSLDRCAALLVLMLLGPQRVA